MAKFIILLAMLESMRYHTKKLSELLHEKKSYNLHMSSVDKIMHKSNNDFFRRSRQLSQLKSRKIQAYNYTQTTRSKEIGHVNAILFTKINRSALLPHQEASEPLQDLQEQLEQRIEQARQQIPPLKRPFVLRNHRQSPINKSTLLERTRENIRLAKKVIQPVVTYKTSEYQKMHQNAKALKERIMKYEPALAKPKAELYVTKRLNSSWASIQKHSPPSSPSSLAKLNPEGKSIFQGRFNQYKPN